MSDADFIARLILYHRQANQAAGIGFEPAFVRGLAAYLPIALQAETEQQRQNQATVRGGYLNGFIQEMSKIIQMEIKDAADMGPDNRRVVLERVTKMQQQVTQAAAQLEQLTNG
jgi:hypothetical protein